MNRTLTFNCHEATVLAKAALMAGLDQNEAEALRACATVRLCDPYDVLFEEADKAASFYCVLSGYVRLYRRNGDGRQADIRICEPGDSFAECLIHADETYHYGAQAMDHAVLACFDIAKVQLLLEERPRIGKAITRSLSLHLISMMECLASDRMQTAPQRVAHYLLTHCAENGAAASLRLPFPKNLLARKLGLAPEALSRAFSTLKTKGVTVRGRAIAISDVNLLRRI
ncbi:Crp/Fnr family transcriptional regulator [Rhizobium leguminosarum]|uniref:Cyclic nucleotide-binding domain family protein n=1 Tax=Rhizobium leguminosarum TaxID=384 RepID=A0A2Z4YH79_RHILE|nr:Crp/Fnr family transcriptional regulator [Rhizobium leguminosarum]AXA39553.1 Cyclic nucleotide-binding domain family protein [Rhizobium leguminosarum]